MAEPSRDSAAQAVRPHGTGCAIAVRVQPRASRNELAGLHGRALRVRLTAPPVDGRANDALLGLLADVLHVSRSSLTLARGGRGRDKVVVVGGVAPEEAGRLLAAAVAGRR